MNLVKKVLKFRPAIALAASFLVTMLIFAAFGYEPFGLKSVAGADANIQYLDLFAYLKDVLAGKNSATYTMSALLGGDEVATFAYYLMSPLNLLVVFFQKSQLPIFYDILLALKLSLSASSMAIFLKQRFPKITRKFQLFLAMSYAFCQYNIAQSCNILWLDGVYLLPLILLGIYQLVAVDKRKGFFLLTISIACSMVFNWYTGLINIIFSAIWLVVEEVLYLYEHSYELKALLKRLGGYLSAVFLGLALSAFIFLPNYVSLKSGARSTFDWDLLKPDLINNPFTVIGKLGLNVMSDSTNVSLYCGSIVVIAVFALFFSKELTARFKTIMALLGLGMLLLFYWQPANFAFSLFKLVDSYWSRYSYLVIFILIFMSGIFFSQVKDKVQPLFYGTAAYLIIFIIQNWKNLTSKGVVYTALSTALTVALLIFYEKAGKKGIRKLAIFALTGLLLTEFAYNAKKLWATYKDDYKVAKVDKFAAYSSQQEKQIAALKRYDPGAYRVSQTSTRLKLRLNLTAAYNEDLAYNYWPIASYVSSQDPKQLKFLESVGYRSAAQRVTIVNTSVLGADSLLGVKYVLTGQALPGLEKTALPAANGKSVYHNPYALPLAFSSQNDVNNPVFTGNPFTYQEAAYSQLLGKKVTLYKRVAYKKAVQAGKVTFVLNSKNKKNPLYGNLPWSQAGDNVLEINGKVLSNYAGWLSPSVFFIPVQKRTRVTLKTKTPNAYQAQFYQLDLQKLAKASQEIQAKAIKQISFKGPRITFTAIGKKWKTSYAYLEVPVKSGWKATNNGKKAEIFGYLGTFMKFKLKPGVNKIQLAYTIPKLKLGSLISGLAALVLLLVAFWPKIGQRSRK